MSPFFPTLLFLYNVSPFVGKNTRSFKTKYHEYVCFLGFIDVSYSKQLIIPPIICLIILIKHCTFNVLYINMFCIDKVQYQFQIGQTFLNYATKFYISKVNKWYWCLFFDFVYLSGRHFTNSIFAKYTLLLFYPASKNDVALG